MWKLVGLLVLTIMLAATSAQASKIVGNGYTAEQCQKAGGYMWSDKTCRDERQKK